MVLRGSVDREGVRPGGSALVLREFAKLLEGHRPPVSIPLHFIAVHALEHRHLLLGLGALGHDAQRQGMGQAHEALDDGPAGRVARHLDDERSVHLERVDRKPRKVGKR